MPNIAVNPQIDIKQGENGSYNGAMALDRTPEKNAHQADWINYLTQPPVIEQKQIDVAQYQVEHQPTSQTPVSQQVVEVRPQENSFTIGGKNELRPHFNSETVKPREVTTPEVKQAPEVVSLPEKAAIAKTVEVINDSRNSEASFGEKLQEFGVDLPLFKDKIINPIFSFFTGGFKFMFDSMKDLGTTHVFYKEKKKETEEEKQKKALQAANKKSFYEGLKANLEKHFISSKRRAALRSRIQEINSQIGNKNLNYEGILNENDEIREEVLMMAEKANSEKTKEQIAHDKRRRMMTASGSAQKKGPGVTMSQDLAHNANNAAKLAG